MSFEAIHWAAEREIDAPLTKFLLVILSQYADSDWSCFPSQKRVAEQMSISERTVRRHMGELEKLGLIRREVRRRSDGTRSTDRIILTPKTSTGQSDRLQSSTGHARPHQPDTGGQNNRTQVSGLNYHLKENYQVNVNPHTPFDDFWKEYPRRVGRLDAEKAFAKHARKVGAETIIAGARKFAADPNLPDQNFIPHPSTWLNRGGWDDDPLPPRNQTEATGTQRAKAAYKAGQKLQQAQTQQDRLVLEAFRGESA